MVAGSEVIRQRLSHREHQDWLGFVTGTAVSGFLGVVLALTVSQHLAAGHRNWIDRFGLWWAISSIGLLGFVIAMLPLIHHDWRGPGSARRWRMDQLKGSRSN